MCSKDGTTRLVSSSFAFGCRDINKVRCGWMELGVCRSSFLPPLCFDLETNELEFKQKYFIYNKTNS